MDAPQGSMRKPLEDSAPMERIASGYALAEAPVAAPDGGLYFSDALGGGVYRWSPDSGEVETVIPKRRGVGGMALHEEGGLVVSGRDVSHVRDGETTTLFADEAATGINDLTVDPDGRVVAGVLRFHPFAGDDPVPGEFVRVDPDGSAATVMPDVGWTNGCAFSPGGDIFYGCDYGSGLVLAANRDAGGRYGPPRTLWVSTSGQADGMAVDEDGAVWVALGAGAAVARIAPDGVLDQQLNVPSGFVASVCFGGADRRDLFITTGGDPADPENAGAVFLTRAPVAGASIPAVRR
jgi:gluconolactonase